MRFRPRLAKTGTNKYIYTYSDFKYAETLMKNALKVGIALALESDQFLVVRFKLDGSRTALDALQEAINEVSKTKAGATTDQVL